MQAVVDRGSHEDVMITTRTSGQRTRAKDHIVAVHEGGVEDESRTVQHAAVVIAAQNENRCLVLNVLVEQELCVVRGVGCNQTADEQMIDNLQ